MTYYYRCLTFVPILIFTFLLPAKNEQSAVRSSQFASSSQQPAARSRQPDNNINIILKDSLFDMCSVMTGDEVASLSPFNKPIKEVTPQDRMDGYCGCHYDLQSEDDYPQVQISVNQFSSAQESKVDYIANKEGWINLYQRQPEFISNLGDSASFYGNADPALCDDCGLQVASGRFYITVAFKGFYDKISATTKRDASINIVRKLFEKKPYLNSRRKSG